MIVVGFVDTAEYVFLPAERHFIQQITNVAEADVRTRLPQLKDRIKMTVKTSAKVIPTTGAMGATIGQKGHIVWTVDPSRPEGLLGIAKAYLRPTLFHELNHVVRKQGQSHAALLQRTILDFVVSEGLATTFERDEGGQKPLWGQYPSEVQSWVHELIGLPPEAPFHDWMFRHPDGRRWIGYKAGTYIVDRAAKASGLSSSKLVELSTKKLFELAGFPL